MSCLRRSQRQSRVDRWLAKRGKGLPLLTADGAALLDRRLRARWRAEAVGGGVAVLAIAAMGASLLSVRPGRGGSTNRSTLAWCAVSLALLAVAALTRAVLMRMGERRLAATLTRRVSRSSAVPVWRQLGLLRLINCGYAGTIALVALGVLIAAHAGAATIALFAGAIIVVGPVSAVALWDLVHAPALAVDEGSLAADRRLRRLNVFHVVWPMVVIAACASAQISAAKVGHDSRPDMTRGSVAFEVLTYAISLPFTLIDGIARSIDERDITQTPRWRRWGPIT